MFKLDSFATSETSNQPESPANSVKWWDLQTRLMVSIQYNDLGTAKSILDLDFGEGRIDPDNCSFHSGSLSAICLAIDRGHYEMTRLLIDRGASVNRFVSGMSPIHFAAKNGYTKILKMLIAERANVNSVSHYGQTPLHLAAQTTSHESVQELIRGGANIEKKDLEGQTALSIACLNNQLKVAEVLIKFGADVNTLDNGGNSPLLHAMGAGLCINSQLVKLLLDAGANPDQMNTHGHLALITAVRRCSESNLEGQYTIKELIEHNCHIDTREAGPFGETAIHLAISRGQDRITEMLIRAGCDISVQNFSGLKPLERLATEGKIDLVKLLLASGATATLSKSSWIRLNGQDEAKSLTIRCLLENWNKDVPSLKHLCRVKLRRTWARESDEIINTLILPVAIKRFLLLLDL